MKPRYQKIAILTLSTLLFTSAGAAVAFGGPKGHGGCDRNRDARRGPMTQLMQIDNLTEDQKKVITDIRNTNRDTMRDLRDEMHDNRRDLRDAFEDKADMDTIRDLAKKQGDQVARMIVLRAEARNKINTVLNEKQRRQLQDMPWSGKEFGPGPKGF
jgi:Spy/CpxP family protein refolding chaperone